MPETRKHRVEPRDEIDRALFAAMGEPVRPSTPGEPRTEPDEGEPEASAPPATTLFVTPGTALGAYSFGQQSAPRDT